MSHSLGGALSVFERSRKAAKECSPRRKPCGSHPKQILAPKERKKLQTKSASRFPGTGHLERSRRILIQFRTHKSLFTNILAVNYLDSIFCELLITFTYISRNKINNLMHLRLDSEGSIFYAKSLVYNILQVTLLDSRFCDPICTLKSSNYNEINTLASKAKNAKNSVIDSSLWSRQSCDKPKSPDLLEFAA